MHKIGSASFSSFVRRKEDIFLAPPHLGLRRLLGSRFLAFPIHPAPLRPPALLSNIHGSLSLPAPPPSLFSKQRRPSRQPKAPPPPCGSCFFPASLGGKYLNIPSCLATALSPTSYAKQKRVFCQVKAETKKSVRSTFSSALVVDLEGVYRLLSSCPSLTILIWFK